MFGRSYLKLHEVHNEWLSYGGVRITFLEGGLEVRALRHERSSKGCSLTSFTVRQNGVS
jgi:hypothetical protein